MLAIPAFASTEEYLARRQDAAFWKPYVAEVLGRHGLPQGDPVAGYNPTHPTFVVGDVVVKLFGPAIQSFEAERAAHAVVVTDPGILAPRVVADGWLFEDAWPYLVTERMRGAPVRTPDLALAETLGEQVRRIHALAPDGVATHEDWATVDVTEGAERSSLPPHLVAQVADYLADLGRVDPVFMHADLVEMHVFVKDGRLTGIIDWGDALVGDRHLDLIQVYRDTLDCDKGLFRAFLDAAAWPVDDDFARRALGMALHRQAIGLAQHHGMDVFEPIAERFPLHEIETLEELAVRLFGP